MKSNEQIEQDASRMAGHMLDRVRLTLAEKIARLIGVLITSIVIGLIITLLVIFLSLSAASALAMVMPTWAACLIIVLGDIVLMIGVIALRKPLIIYPLVAAMVSVLLERPVKYREIETEKTRLELEIEKDKIRLYQDLEGWIIASILGWIRKIWK